MSLTARTPGAWAAGTTSISPSLPASAAAGDMLILFVGAKPYDATINQPTGWTRLGTQQTNGTTASSDGLGSTTWSVFYRLMQGGDSAPTVSVTSGNVALACIHGYTKTKATWVTPAAYFGGDSTTDTTINFTFSGSSGNLTANDALVSFAVVRNDHTFTNPAIAATSATIGTVTESPATEGATTLGDDLGASSATASVSSGTSSADATGSWDLGGLGHGGGALVRLREVDGTLYYVIYPAAKSPPSATQIKAGQDVDGGAATASGNEASPTTTTDPFTFASAATGLSAGTPYKISFVWSDGTNNSSVVTSSAWGTNSSGTLAVTDKVDTAAFAGGVLVSGTFAVTDKVDTAAFSGSLVVSGSFALTDKVDTAAFAGDVYVAGTFAPTDKVDTAAFAGDVYVSGTLAATDNVDTAQFSSSQARTGTLAATETGVDSASFGQESPVIENDVALDNTWTATAASDSNWIEEQYAPKGWAREVRSG